MGEYANFGGKQIKIGTCEDMYYLRFSQRHMIQALRGNVDPSGNDALSIRFRFPWPDEDNIQPGGFDAYNRSLAVPGATMPEGVDHYSVQFRADAGYLVSLPCPEGPSSHGLKVHRNGFGGAVRLQQQKLLKDGRVVPVCVCGGCGSAWRIEEESDIKALADAFFTEGERRRKDSWTGEGKDVKHVCHVFWHTIAQRILDGARITTEADAPLTIAKA